ncbi:MAG TPA: acyl carrier protein [Thermoleophilaceae bacterium]|jgi:acyl carrier protein
MDTAPLQDLHASLGTLAELLETASAGAVKIADPVADADLPLRSLGLDSIAYVAFLNGIEEAFGIRWAYEEPKETFETLGTIAARLERVKGGEG